MSGEGCVTSDGELKGVFTVEDGEGFGVDEAAAQEKWVGEAAAWGFGWGGGVGVGVGFGVALGFGFWFWCRFVEEVGVG